MPVELTTPLDAAGQPGSARPGRDRPAPVGLPRPRGRAGRWLHPRCRERPPGRRHAARARVRDDRGRDRPGRPAPASTRSASIAARGSASSRPATRSARPAQPLGPAGIPDANGPGLRAQVAAAGRRTDRSRDRGGRPRRRAQAAARRHRGRRRRAHHLGRRVRRAVRRREDRDGDDRTGRPLAGGGPTRQAVRVRDRAATRSAGAAILVFGLPGNPVSSAVTFELFVRPAIRRLAGRRGPAPSGRSGRPRSSRSPRATVVGRSCASRRSGADDGAPVRDERGRVRVRLAGGQGSHVLSALAAADALAIVPEAVDSLPAGAEVAIWWLDSA